MPNFPDSTEPITIEAVYENGVLRPLTPLALPEGQCVRISIVAEEAAGSQSAGVILAEIASLPVEGTGDPFTSRDHDRSLYGANEMPSEGPPTADAASEPSDPASPPFQFTLWQLMCFVTLFSVVCGLTASCVKIVQRRRESALAAQCRGNLKQIALGILSYEERWGCLPPAYEVGKHGKPAHSWRWLIGQYLDCQRIWDEYDFREAWNGPNNSRLSVPLPLFQCRSSDVTKPLTAYVAVVGPNTMWPGKESARLAKNGSDHDKILLIEITNSDINWMEPRDLTLDEALGAIQPAKGVGIGSPHPDGIHYVTVGGEVRTLERDIDRESLRKLLTKDVAKPSAERTRQEKLEH
jgi:predicted DNA-binding antitoxin AbrB/MazE fold protein